MAVSPEWRVESIRRRRKRPAVAARSCGCRRCGSARKGAAPF